jgi:hypothetical protein
MTTRKDTVNKSFRVAFSVQANWQILVSIQVDRAGGPELWVDWGSVSTKQNPNLSKVPQRSDEDDGAWGQRLDDSFGKVVKRNGDDNLHYAARLLGRTLKQATVIATFQSQPANFDGGKWASGADPDKPDTYRMYASLVTPTQEGHYEYTVKYDGGHSDPAAWDVSAASDESPLSPRRKLMLQLIDKWMPTSMLDADQDGGGNSIRSMDNDGQPIHKKQAVARSGQTSDLLKLAGWTEQMGKDSKNVTVYNKEVLDAWATRQKIFKELNIEGDPQPQMGGDLKPLATSCGDVLKAMLVEWGCDWDEDRSGKAQAFGISIEARKKGYYVLAMDAFRSDPPRLPRPGDLLVLRSESAMRGDGKPKPPPFASVGFLAHVCIVQEVQGANDGDVWITADGGGGILPDQVAKQNNPRTVVNTAPSTSTDDLKVYGMPWKQFHDALPARYKDLYEAGPFPNGLVCLSRGSQAEAYGGFNAEMVDGWVDLDRVPNLDASLGPTGPAAGTKPEDYQRDKESAEKFKTLWDNITKQK